MKPYASVLITIISIIMLICLQLCLFSYQQHSQFNPTLIAYMYVLMTSCSITLLTIFSLILDMMMYLITGVFGISILFLTPLSWLALKFKDDMYNKIVIPCCCIMLYIIFYNIISTWHLACLINYIQMFYAILQNCILFVIIWMVTKQPLHD